MKSYRLEYRGIDVTLAKEPFAGGGEGNLFAILEPLELMNHVAKIYHENKLTDERKQKISYLAQYPPYELSESNKEHPSIVWVEDALYEDDRFVGFIMPFTSGDKLEILCTPKIPKKLRVKWRRFDYKVSEKALDARLKLCFNLCAAIYQVHAMDRYVLVDMKPDNIIIRPNGLVSIVDTDSVEVVENGRSLFDAPVATPEYTPPEYYRKTEKDPTESETWDRFGLAVILYKVLFGIHPFAASAKAPYDHLVSLDDKIEAGLFVHHPNHRDSFQIIPPPHQKFEDLDPELKQFFIQCFVDGHQNPEARPTAEHWCAALLGAMNDEAAFKRYAHVLGHAVSPIKTKFKRPSTLVEFPFYNQDAYNMLNLSKAQELPDFNVKKDLGDVQPYNFNVVSGGPLRLIFTVFAFFVLVNLFGPLSALAVAYFLNKEYKKYKLESMYLRKDLLESEVDRLQKSFKKQKQLTSKAQKRFSRSIRSFKRAAHNYIFQIKKEVDELQKFMASQDEKVEKIEQQALEQYYQLNQRVVETAAANRAVSRVYSDKTNSLLKLKIAHDKSYRIAVSSLLDGKDMSEYPDMKHGKIAVDELLNKQKDALNNSSAEAIEQLNSDQEFALSQIEDDIDAEADVLQNIDRLWKGMRKINQNLASEAYTFFENNGFTSIRQVRSINNRTKVIVLKDGRTIQLKALKKFKYILKYLLKNMWQWYDEIKHKEQVLQHKQSDVKDTFRIKIKAVDEDKRIALKDLERNKKRQLQVIEVEVQKKLFGAPFVKLHTEYQMTKDYLQQLEDDFEHQENQIMDSHADAYEQIIEQTNKKVQQAAAKIKLLESNISKYSNKINNTAVRGKYNQLKDELYKTNQQFKKLVKKSEELKRYDKVNFINYLKKSYQGWQ